MDRHYKPSGKSTNYEEISSFFSRLSAVTHPPVQPSVADLAVRNKLASYAEFNAAAMNTRGADGRAVADVLNTVGIYVPNRLPKDIKDIPYMRQQPRTAPLQPGDVVVVGPQVNHGSQEASNGSAFIVTKNRMAASDHIAKIPNLSRFNDVRIYRVEN